jgi:BirA family biotin operon repressor/biotin-[acetyl-CoA-carboxylase] ligase
MLNLEALQSGVPRQGLGEPLEYYDCIGSTNDRANVLAREGAPHGTLVVADEQTQGRGRMGRRWYTPPGQSIAFSLVIRPRTQEPGVIGWVGLWGALAVQEVLTAMGLDAIIKWPNDVLLGNQKVSGVLAEAIWEGERLQYLILGIGINVRPGSIQPLEALGFPATCIEYVYDQPVSRADLLLAVVERLGVWFPDLGSEKMVSVVESGLAYLGQRVKIEVAGVSYAGVFEGLNREGALKLNVYGERSAIQSIGASNLYLLSTP